MGTPNVLPAACVPHSSVLLVTTAGTTSVPGGGGQLLGLHFALLMHKLLCFWQINCSSLSFSVSSLGTKGSMINSVSA